MALYFCCRTKLFFEFARGQDAQDTVLHCHCTRSDHFAGGPPVPHFGGASIDLRMGRADWFQKYSLQKGAGPMAKASIRARAEGVRHLIRPRSAARVAERSPKTMAAQLRSEHSISVCALVGVAAARPDSISIWSLLAAPS